MKEFLKYLSGLCREISLGHYKNARELFELTKQTGDYPEEINELAEAFGMMLVKVEAREFNLLKIIDELEETKEKLELAKEKLARDNVGLRKTLGRNFSINRIVGQSKKIRELLKQVEKVADTPVNVLITGETGTGKELIAKALHYNSSRHREPFIAINCSAIPESLFESELFGIEKGVATGVAKRTGRIQQANGGTLFLDEIGDMPLESQAKILRVLEEREVCPLGCKKPIPVDIRLVAATNKDLKEEVQKGRMRSDLYYRIKVVHFQIPPLRDRQEDIPLLLTFFAERYSKIMSRNPIRFSAETVELMKRYSWPGNIRELENEVERAVALASGDIVYPEDLSEEIRNSHSDTKESYFEGSDNLREHEKVHILKVLEKVGGNRTRAAKRLGISREGLRKKMKRYSIT